MRKRAYLVGFLYAIDLLIVWPVFAQEGKSTGPVYVDYAPLLRSNEDWTFNEYWHGKTIGPKDFYMADQGPYLRISEEGVAKLKQVGLYHRTIPGHINYSFLKYFLPEERAKLKDGPMKTMFEEILANKWPVHTLVGHHFYGNPIPPKRLYEIIADQWLGEGMGETVYRLEPIFHYLKTGERWEGSSMYLWSVPALKRFFQECFLPRLDKELPFYREPGHQWTRPELRMLSDIYCEEFFRPEGRVMPWGMMLSSYYLASLPGTRAIAEKGADAFTNARGRGMMRQFGGGKFYFVWRGHEPIEMYMYPDRAWYTTRGDEWGLPLPHIWYYLYRPYLIGANYYVNEHFPAACIQDIEDDKQYELSTLGYILKDMLDFVDRHPERGIAYSPIALMLDYNRAFGAWGTTYFGYNLPNDDADFMNEGIFELLFPEHRHARDCGGYCRTAPYGEIFDILQPNMPKTGADPKALANYKVLFALGGMTFDEDFSNKVKAHVRRGGALVLNVADVTPQLGEEFLGFAPQGEPLAGGNVTCTLCGHITQEPPYLLHPVKLATAQAIFKDAEGRPVVVRNRYGEGEVVTVLAHYGTEKDIRRMTRFRGPAYMSKRLLNFVPHFFEHLVVGLTPIEVRRTAEDRPDLSWIIAKKGEGWLVTMFNYSLAREPIIAKTYGTAKVHAEYPLKEVPFEIVCRAPVEDVAEWYEDRDVHWRKVDGKAVISETIHGGEIRVYELQPRKIDFGKRRRFVNYALNRPVKASSYLKGYEPQRAVNGNLDRDDYWWSDTDPKRHYTFEMPQWIQVDLGEEKIIDHIFVLFYYWKQESLLTRLRVYKYVVEASLDGQTWQVIMDESKNEDNARPEGIERWFEPTRARYVRLTVTYDSARGGVRLIEMMVMGKETEEYELKRKSIIPTWEVQYPTWVTEVPKENQVYLINLRPEKVSVGWMPAGKTWEELNGDVTLMTTLSGMGREYPKSIYAEAPSEIVYNLDGKYKTFVAAAGFGSNSNKSSVEFVVYVDDKEKYKSSLFRIGMSLLPVVVDVTGAKKLKLVVTDGGDGLIDDYAWWGEARLIMK